MSTLETDGFKVFATWNHQGMTGRLRRPRDSAQPAKLMIAIDNGPTKVGARRYKDTGIDPLARKVRSEVGPSKDKR
jgi:hypothetical protein